MTMKMDRIEKSELESELLKRLVSDKEVVAKYHVYNNGSRIVAEYCESTTKEHDDMVYLVYEVVKGSAVKRSELCNSEHYSFFAIFPTGKQSQIAYLVSRELLKEDAESGKVRRDSKGLYYLTHEYLDYNATKKLKAC